MIPNMLYAEVDVSGIYQDSVKRHFIKTICTTLVEMQINTPLSNGLSIKFDLLNHRVKIH